MQDFLKSLELGEDASWNDVKRHYLDQLKVWHPDRFAGDERLRKKAEERTKVINYAYSKIQQTIKQLKSEGLELDSSKPLFAQCVKNFIDNEPPPVEEMVSSLEKSRNYEQESFILAKGKSISISAPDDDDLEDEARRHKLHLMLGGGLALVALTGTLAFVGVASFANSNVDSGRKLVTSMEESLNIAIGEANQDDTVIRESGYQSVKNPHLDSLISGSEGSERIITGLGPKKKSTAPSIIRAASRCDARGVKKYLDRGIDINTSDDQGMSPLSWAAKKNCEAVAKLLIARGADTNHMSVNGFTPLNWAKWFKNIDVIKVMEIDAKNIREHAKRSRKQKKRAYRGR
jgi:hypothetical protein